MERQRRQGRGGRQGRRSGSQPAGRLHGVWAVCGGVVCPGPDTPVLRCAALRCVFLRWRRLPEGGDECGQPAPPPLSVDPFLSSEDSTGDDITDASGGEPEDGEMSESLLSR